MVKLPKEWRWAMWRLALLGVLPGLGNLSGCGFFPPITQCTTNCTTSSDFMYVANSSDTTASPASVAGFSLTTTTTAATATTPATSTLALAVTPGSAYTTGYMPTSLAITPKNTFVYVAAVTGGIYLYSVGSNGALTLQNNSQPVATGLIASAMKVDTTGAYLLVAGASLPTTQASMSVFSIASTTGLLTAVGKALTIPVLGASSHLTVAANDVNVFLTIGTGGTASMTFNSTTGALIYQSILAPKSTQGAAVGVTTNPSTTSPYVFVTETAISAVRVLSIGTNGALTEVVGSPFATGTGPSGVLVSADGSYVYVTNSTAGNISGFVLTANGSLTPIAGSPFATGTTPVDIAEDSTGAYVGVVCTGGGQDLEVYSFDATTGGALDAAANATTGTDPALPIAIVATH